MSDKAADNEKNNEASLKNSQKGSSGRAKITPLKKFIFTMIMLGGVAVFIELSVRAFLAIKIGPDVLWYGTGYCCGTQGSFNPKGKLQGALFGDFHTVYKHENKKKNYGKYFPHQTRVDHDEQGEIFSVTINSHGFRGREFSIEKTPGVIRVVTLGASSTFGYHDRDNETYPYYMQEMLNRRLQDKTCPNIDSFEVINLGIPHLETPNILSLFREEGRAFHPDVVTFYEGWNNAAASVGILHYWRKEDNIFLYTYYKMLKKFGKKLLSLSLLENVTFQVKEYSSEKVKTILAGKKDPFFQDLEALHRDVAEIGATFVVGSQQAKSSIIEKEKMAGVSYADEVELIQQHLANGELVKAQSIYFLSHDITMKNLEAFANKHNIRYVDHIQAMDSRRDYLLSWVHVAPDGNKIIAKGFVDEIFPSVCPKS